MLRGGRVVARTRRFALHRLELPDIADKVWGQPQPGVRRVGALTPKRYAKRAVTRNAVRRQVLASAALLPCEGAYVVRQRAEFSRAQFPSATSTALKRAVRAELTELFSRFRP